MYFQRTKVSTKHNTCEFIYNIYYVRFKLDINFIRPGNYTIQICLTESDDERKSSHPTANMKQIEFDIDILDRFCLCLLC